MRDHAAHIEPASRDTIARWLEALGTVAAGTMSRDEVQIKIAGYVTLLEGRAAYQFTKPTLKAVALACRWFPSVAELGQILDRETEDKAQQVRAARATVNGEAPSRPTYQPEPLGVRLQAIADSYARHYGADHPKTVEATAKLAAHAGEAST